MASLARRRSLSLTLLLLGVICVSVATATYDDGTCRDGSIASSDGTCAAPADMTNDAPAPAPAASSTPPQCGLYLAESTIPGAGLGIYTATEKQPGDSVGRGDVCLPVMDANWHNDQKPVFNPFSDYYWAGYVMGMGREVESTDIEAYCPGLDCAINCSEYFICIFYLYIGPLHMVPVDATDRIAFSTHQPYLLSVPHLMLHRFGLDQRPKVHSLV